MARFGPCFGRSAWAGDAIAARTAGLDHATARLDRRSKLAATRLVSGELLVVATNNDPKIALAPYRRRWEIETLLAATKTRGFNFEDTHLIHPDRIGKLLAVLAVAFAFAHATGEWQAKHRAIVLKTHKRRAQSIFRVGFDLLRKILLTAPNEAISWWQLLIAGQPPRPIRLHGSPQLNSS